MSFISKVDLFNRLIIALELGCKCKISSSTQLIEDLKRCSKLRNTVIHAEWENIDDEGYTYVKMSFNKKGISQNYCQFTPESLDEIEDYIDNTLYAFEKFEDEKITALSHK